MIHVIAIITAKPGQRAAVLANFAANRPTVLAEAGCIEYGAAVDLEKMGTAAYGPDTFVVIEKWENRGSPQGARGRAAHEGIRREDQGHGGRACDPRARAGVTGRRPLRVEFRPCASSPTAGSRPRRAGAADHRNEGRRDARDERRSPD